MDSDTQRAQNESDYWRQQYWLMMGLFACCCQPRPTAANSDDYDDDCTAQPSLELDIPPFLGLLFGMGRDLCDQAQQGLADGYDCLLSSCCLFGAQDNTPAPTPAPAPHQASANPFALFQPKPSPSFKKGMDEIAPAKPLAGLASIISITLGMT